jgi:hypothetical protein
MLVVGLDLRRHGPECGSSRLLSPSIAAKWNCLTVFLTARALNLQDFIMPNQFSKTAIDDEVGMSPCPPHVSSRTCGDALAIIATAELWQGYGVIRVAGFARTRTRALEAALIVSPGFAAQGLGELRQRGPLRSPALLGAARGVDGNLGSAAGRGASPGSADASHLAAASASAEEEIAAIGLEPRHVDSRRHLEPLQDLSRSRIDASDIALVTFPGAVPELSGNPGDPGDEAVDSMVRRIAPVWGST